MNSGAWDELVGFGETFTCYSSALAAWLAAGDEPWQAPLDGGLHLVLSEEPDALFGFSHFPTPLAARLGLARYGADDAADAQAAIRAQLEQDGRVIVRGDGLHLPWHVACGRRSVPHWFTLVRGEDGPEVVDPFDCQTELGRQRATRHALAWDERAGVAQGLPGDDAVLALREAFALGDDARPLPAQRFGWLAAAAGQHASAAAHGLSGPAALRCLAQHFREHGEDPGAYRQADDLWSIARHRGFALRLAQADQADGDWVAEQLAPLVARWAHVAPLLMQARLGAQAGRAPSASLPDTLDELAAREQAAADAREPDGKFRPDASLEDDR
jgi:hypothetical protein